MSGPDVMLSFLRSEGPDDMKDNAISDNLLPMLAIWTVVQLHGALPSLGP